jgi:hypothetical protein
VSCYHLHHQLFFAGHGHAAAAGSFFDFANRMIQTKNLKREDNGDKHEGWRES